MAQKVYLITIKESGKLASFYEAYSSLEKAVKHLKETAKQFNRKLVETTLRNEYKVFTEAGEYVHTLRIVDVWLR